MDDLIKRLREDAESHREGAKIWDMRPEDTMNWWHMETCNLAADALATQAEEIERLKADNARLLVDAERRMSVIARCANIMNGGEGVQDQGEAWEKVAQLLNAAIEAAALAAQVAEPVAPADLEAIISRYVDDYESIYDEGAYTPDDEEKFRIKDAIIGLLADPEWDAAWGDLIDALAAQPAKEATGEDAAVYQSIADNYARATQPAPAAVPPGYVLVPVEPTEAMCAVGASDTGSRITNGRAFARALYRAMIAASQEKT